MDSADPFLRLARKMQATARKLSSWSAQTVGNVRHKMAISREIIVKFDKAQEDRSLTPHETWLHITLNRCYFAATLGTPP